MSTDWEDVEKEAAYDQMYEQMQEEIKLRDQLLIAKAIENGWITTEKNLWNLVHELKKISPATSPVSFALLNCIILETVERETLCLPMLIAGLGIEGQSEKRIEAVKKLLSVQPSRFLYEYFENSFSETDFDMLKFKSELDANALACVSPKWFKKGTIWWHREKVSGFRNQLAHGRHTAEEREALFVSQFVSQWRESVLNMLLRMYGLELDELWGLRSAKIKLPQKINLQKI